MFPLVQSFGKLRTRPTSILSDPSSPLLCERTLFQKLASLVLRKSHDLRRAALKTHNLEVSVRLESISELKADVRQLTQNSHRGQTAYEPHHVHVPHTRVDRTQVLEPLDSRRLAVELEPQAQDLEVRASKSVDELILQRKYYQLLHDDEAGNEQQRTSMPVRPASSN